MYTAVYFVTKHAVAVDDGDNRGVTRLGRLGECIFEIEIEIEVAESAYCTIHPDV